MKRVYTNLSVVVNNFLSDDKRTFKWLERATKQILTRENYKPETLDAWNSIMSRIRMKRVKIGYNLNKEIKTFVDNYIE